jgi:hypothetical protein
MKKLFLLLFLIGGLSLSSQAQTLSAPTTENVFGGTVQDIEVFAFHPDSICVVLASQSANSIFFAKAKRGSTRVNLRLHALPSADINDGFGDSIRQLEVHARTGTIFFVVSSRLYRTTLSSSTATQIDQLVKSFMIHGDTLVMVKNNRFPSGNDTLEWGPINSAGIFTATNGRSLLRSYNEPPQLLINPSNNRLHIFDRGATPHMYMLGDAFNAMNNSTALASAVNPAPSVPNTEWRTYGIAPNGDWYVAGQPPLNTPTVVDRKIAWSYNNGASWNHSSMNAPGPIGGVVGNNMLIEDAGGARTIYIGSMILKDTAFMSTWVNPGSVYVENFNRVNDAITKRDPINPDMKYHATNVGFGYSTNRGDSVFAWNTGFEAVQVNDIDMTASFNIGWIASKSGLFKVENYKTPSPTWYPPRYPNGDGAPCQAIAIDPTNDQRVFAGNQRIYRTVTGGSPSGSSPDGWDRVFTPESAPYNYNRINSYCTSIKVSPDSSNIVMAGFSQLYSDKGGLFWSKDGGNTWSQLLLRASSLGQDVDVNDIAFTFEAGQVVAYIGVEADVTTAGAYGLFKAVWNGSTWITARDGSYGATDAIIDLHLNASRDSLLVLNYDPGILPVNNIQAKALSSSTWSGLPGPTGVGGVGSAITIGAGHVFLAIGKDIYASPLTSFFAWALAYSYPSGTQINALFYDDLLVGTGTGLYGHDFNPLTSSVKPINPLTKLVYPNPVHDRLYYEGMHRIRLFNALGQLVYQSMEKETEIKTDHLHPGMYFISFDDGTIGKFIVKH